MDSVKVLHGKYFPHIDGIRTIGVLSVVLYHIFGNLCPGGYVGVDIFFVISGYLITGGILKSLDKGNFTIKNFYERRIRRIIPAYVVLIAFVMLSSLVFPPNLLKATLETSAFSSIFATNFFFPFNTGGYFDPISETNPLLHLWSLGVEEQFYIFSPVFLLFVYKINKKLILPSLLSVVALSLALSLYCNFRGSNTLSFYMLPTRTWEFMAGSLFAYWNNVSPSIKLGGGASKLLGLSGIIMSFLVCYIYNSATPFPGIAAIPPVLGALLMIRWGNKGISKLILESKPFVGIGKVSYSLYLWHWPFIIYWRYFSDSPNNIWGLLSVFALSLILAWLSWRFVEMPVRLSKSWNFKRALLWVIIGCGGIGITSTILIHIKFPDYWAKFIIGKNYAEPYWKGSISRTYCSEMSEICKISRKIDPEFIPPYDLPCFRLGTSENASYLLLGDSHAMALSPGLNYFSEKNKIDGIFYNDLFSLQTNINAQPILDEILNFIRNHPNIKTIIFINRWANRFGELPNEENINKIIVDNSKNQRSITIRQSEIWLRQFCSQLKSLNKKVILISSIPEQGINVPEKCYEIKILGKRSPHGIDENKYKERQLNVSKTLKKIEQDGLAKILWIDDFFFKGRKNCRITNDEEFPLYFDDDHLNPTGAKELINYYSEELLRLLSPNEKDTVRNPPPVQ